MSIDQIPPSLAAFFQEYEVDQLDLERDVDVIIERALRFGNRDELGWLFACYGKTRIVKWVRDLGEYRLPARHFSFWQIALDIEPPDQAERQGEWPH